METTEKFSTKINKAILARLRLYSRNSERKISVIVSEALAAYLNQIEVRPTFRDVAEEVIQEHEELLRELAK